MCKGLAFSSGRAGDLEDAVGDPSCQLGRRAFEKQFAFVQQQHPVAAFRFVEIGRRPHDADTGSGQVFDHFPQVSPGYGIDTDAGFVKQKQTRFAQQSAGKSEFLFHASGKLAG
ncbi:hypothetical protein D9M69_564500 [compost metagenome]